MDQDEMNTTETTTEATTEAELKRGPILATLLIRVTIREDDTVTEGSYVPTNDEAIAWTEEAFRARGYTSVNATAEKV